MTLPQRFRPSFTSLLYTCGIAALITASACSTSQSGSQAGGPGGEPKGGSDKDKKIKAYDKVITKEAVSDSGLFISHRIDDKYFFEIPKNQLNKEFLLVSRISKTPQIGYGGEESNTSVIRWERKADKVYLRTVSYENVAADSLPISRAVKASNFEEIIRAFPIQAYNGDSSNIVIDVTDFFTSDIGILTPDKNWRLQTKIMRMESSRSYVEYIRSFPTNVEIENVITFEADNPVQNPSARTVTVGMHHSMVELPQVPMISRLADARVGYFSLYNTDYGRNEPEAVPRQYILRWRLEPKDTAAFLRGELVEPIKPITWYIDPNTPERWRPWLRKGVESWNEAFEAAGFKNAIRCIDPPTAEQDSEWSAEDARYSVIRYYPSDIENAYGPNIHDPRTGEIIESDIGWFHNIIKLLNSWYFTQAVGDPTAHKLPIPDDKLNEFVAYVAAHEVGHTLGLPHNMKASNAYPTDSLRSPSFTERYGTTPSIMDYARANYVAQPGDGVRKFLPGIGVYDKHSIRWGYRPIINAKTSDAEKDTLHAWARASETNKMLRFGAQQWNTVDPFAQMEDLGDDAIKSTTYGIANLKRAIGYVYDATYKEGESFRSLNDAYDDILGQFMREMSHVANIPAGVDIDRKVFGVSGPVYTPLPKERMKAAVQYVSDNMFTTPSWLLDERLINTLYPSGSVQRLSNYQANVMRTLISNDKLLRLVDQQTRLGASAYSVAELFADVEKGVFTELTTKAPTDFYRRGLQRSYIQALIDKNEKPEESTGGFHFVGQPVVWNTDVRAISRAQLRSIQKKLQTATSADPLTKAHFEDLVLQISRALDASREP